MRNPPRSHPDGSPPFTGWVAGLLAGAVWIGLAGCTTVRETVRVPESAVPPVEAAAELLRSDRVAALLGLEENWVVAGSRLVMSGSAGSLEVEVDRREARVNGIRVFLGEPPVAQSGHLYFSRSDVERCLMPILGVPGTGFTGPLRTIAVDAGHGGSDSGTRNRLLGLEEKELTLDVARRLEDALVRRGFRVLMIRRDDVFVPLGQRPALAAGANLFISIHFNATGNPEVSGTETYVLTRAGQASTGVALPFDGDVAAHPGNRWDGASAAAGFELQRRLVRAFGTVDRGLKQARFAVLRDLPCPGVLVESAFLSHPGEASRVSTERYRVELAEILADAVGALARRVEKEEG